MNKQYMVQVLELRIKELESKYRTYFDTDGGPSKSKRGAACMRSRVKKDLDTVKLLRYLIARCPDEMTLPDSLESAFSRLTGD